MAAPQPKPRMPARPEPRFFADRVNIIHEWHKHFNLRVKGRRHAEGTAHLPNQRPEAGVRRGSVGIRLLIGEPKLSALSV